MIFNKRLNDNIITYEGVRRKKKEVEEATLC